MAASQTNTNFLKLVAQGDIFTGKMIVAGVLITKTAVNTAAYFKLVNAASTVEYVPLTPVATAAAPVYYIPFAEEGGAHKCWDGVKAANCTGCTIMVYKR